MKICKSILTTILLKTNENERILKFNFRILKSSSA